MNPVVARSSTKAVSSPTWRAHPGGESRRLVGVHHHWQAGAGPLVDASLDRTAPGPGRFLVGDALAVLGRVEGDGRVAPVPHEASGEPEHFGARLWTTPPWPRITVGRGPSGGLRQPDDARHRLAAHLEPDPSLDNTALADFLDCLHGPALRSK